MLHSKHIINPNRIASNSDLNSGGNYPIGLNLENFMDLYHDVKSFTFSLFSLVDNSQFGGGDISNIMEALQAIEDSANSSSVSSASGVTTRSIRPVGLLDANGEEPLTSQTPTALREYPIHSGGRNSALISINFGKTLLRNGLFYPEIIVTFSNGVASNTSGAIVGSVSFGSFGEIILFGGNVNPLSFVTANGSVEINERYSSITASVLEAKIDGSITFAGGGLTNLEDYITAFMGHAQAPVQFNGSSLVFTIPKFARSGPVRFESSNNPMDAFYTYQSIRII